jgi:hypothetical protein
VVVDKNCFPFFFSAEKSFLTAVAEKKIVREASVLDEKEGFS